ncbi:fimbrial protein [Cedecea neteri]|uniref:fimbrial protein n=1 Tax=Cedecea neteri TaxID=158822 RepID=UPI002AA83878|nr:fimbrial protein [Cedecea neteri]WPU21979.1 fimbrial protein [Cedecea neteri]
MESVFLPGESSGCLLALDQRGNSWQLWEAGLSCSVGVRVPVTPDNCTVNVSTQWNISFGNLERTDIPADSGTEQTRDLSLICTGGQTHNFNVRLAMNPTTWSNNQMVTSNKDLGVRITVDGNPIDVGGNFTMSAQTQATKTLGFSVLRNPSMPGENIATGDFSASGTLVITEQ